MSGFCQTLTIILQRVCENLPGCFPESCQNLARTLPGYYQTSAKDFASILAGFAMILSEYRQRIGKRVRTRAIKRAREEASK